MSSNPDTTQTMPYGLNDNEIAIITQILSQYDEITSVVLFGSRALGNHKVGSDVDLAINGKDLDINTIASLNTQLNEMSPLPYFFDLVDYQNLGNEALKRHINDHGVQIYP